MIKILPAFFLKRTTPVINRIKRKERREAYEKLRNIKKFN